MKGVLFAARYHPNQPLRFAPCVVPIDVRPRSNQSYLAARFQ